MKRYFLLLAAVTLLIFSSALRADNLTQFVTANQAYSQGDYPKAIKLYQEIERDLPNSAALHFNIGNTFFRLGELGEAIFHLKTATRLSPRKADYKFNLQHAEKQTKDKVENTSSPWRNLFFLYSFFNWREMLWVIGVTFFGFWLLSAVVVLHNREWVHWLRWAFLAIFLVVALNGVGKHYYEKPFGVVTAESAKVFSGIGKDNVELFLLHEGTTFEVLSNEQEGWLQVGLGVKKKGWIRSQSVIY
jgi:tetratricopeptide (TPR) repeat protein